MSTDNTALIVIDVQLGFEDASFWGVPANPDADAHIASLIEVWTTQQRGPIVVVRHDSAKPSSPLHPSRPGNPLKPFLADIAPDLFITKRVNSAFLGTPNLDEWLRGQGVGRIVVCGIQTNMCVETTARMGGNLGYQVVVPIDATSTFGIAADLPSGRVELSGAELMTATALNLQAGGFARVTTTAALLAAGPDA
jgi:Amidases related to nicotinamidase